MPSTSDYGDFVAGKLATRLLTAVTSGATVTAQTINGSPVTWPTGAHRLKLVRKTRTGTEVETVHVASASQSGATVTLGTLTRQLSLTSGSSFSSGGNGRTFPANTDVYLTWDVFDADLSVKTDIANTFTGSGAIRSSSTTTPVIRLNNVTTVQREAMTPANGDMVYDTDEGQIYQYIGGAWAAVGDTGTADGSTTAAGKFEEATVAEQGTATATGATGARLVPAVANLVKASSGAGDENKLAILNAAGRFADGFLASGTASSTTFLRGDRTWGTLSNLMFGDGSDGAPTWTSGASLDPSTEKRYTTATVPAGQTVTVSSVNTPLVIHNTSDVTINGTVDMNGKGGAGGAGRTGNGAGTAGTAGNSFISGWTNGAGGASTADGSGGGGGASFDANGTAGTGTSAGTAGTKIDPERVAFLASFLRGMICGGGGGGGSVTGGGGTSGTGGAGGGVVVWMIGGNLTLGADSVIRANGENGVAGSATTAASGQTAGGGGGGGGGMILILVGGTITDSGLALSASAGAGSDGHFNGSANASFKGGDAGAGKAIIYSLSTGTLIAA